MKKWLTLLLLVSAVSFAEDGANEPLKLGDGEFKLDGGNTEDCVYVLCRKCGMSGSLKGMRNHACPDLTKWRLSMFSETVGINTCCVCGVYKNTFYTEARMYPVAFLSSETKVSVVCCLECTLARIQSNMKGN